MILKDVHSFRSKLINMAAILSFMYFNHLFSGPFPEIFLNILLWGTYITFLLLRKSWWTKKRIVSAVLLILLETAAGIFWFHETKLIYFLAIMTLSASMQFSLSKSGVPIMVAMFVAAMLYIRFGREDLFSIFSFLLLSFVIYFWLRNRMQKNEMFELNKLRLVELEEAYDQLQEASVTSMQYAVLEERTRIAREIHDAVGHSLTSLIVQMQALKYMMKMDSEAAEHSLDAMLIVARQGLNDIRASVHSLADDRTHSGFTSLKALLSRMEATASIQYQFQSDLNEEDIEVYGILFRVLQEAITNIIRHSRATQVHVFLKKERQRMIMCIRDNGIMNSEKKVSEGFGLRAMKARLEENGGSLAFTGLAPNGFEITAEIPMALVQKKMAERMKTGAEHRENKSDAR